jgi:hypothetical protein
MTAVMSRSERLARGYTTVIPQGAAGYLPPRDPACRSADRYMAVRRTEGGTWGIVDRRTAKLLAEATKNQHAYASWQDVQTAIAALNGSPA